MKWGVMRVLRRYIWGIMCEGHIIENYAGEVWTRYRVRTNNLTFDTVNHGGLPEKKGISPFFGLILDAEHSRTFRFAFIVSLLLFRILLFALVMTTQVEHWSKTKGVSQTCSQQLHDHASNSLLLTPTTNLSVIPHTLHSSICSSQGLIFFKRETKIKSTSRQNYWWSYLHKIVKQKTKISFI